MTGNSPNALDDRTLDAGLARAAAALDREIAASGAVDRVAGGVAARVAARRWSRRSIWLAIAAAMILAAGLGSVADLVLFNTRNTAGQEVVVMDPLIFGTAMVEQR